MDFCKYAEGSLFVSREVRDVREVFRRGGYGY